MKIILRFTLPIILLLLFNPACGVKKDEQVENSFYYWKSSLSITTHDVARFRRLAIRNLYVKFFDVAWDPEIGQPVPVSVVRFVTPPPQQVKIIPTVFVTNNSMGFLSEKQVTMLAKRMFHKIQYIARQNRLAKYKELQIDCDWTVSTRSKYFKLLTELHRLLVKDQIELSATIRLHQIKYAAQTGIPPVQRGILMFYNFGAPSDPAVGNSVLDLAVGRQYLGHLSQYPLPLDVALPLYSEGVVFQGHRFIGLITNLHRQDLSPAKGFRPEGGNWFLATCDTTLLNTRIYKGDRIRVDAGDYPTCLRSARYLVSQLRSRKMKIALFHYAPEVMKGVPDEKIQRLFDCFH